MTQASEPSMLDRDVIQSVGPLPNYFRTSPVQAVGTGELWRTARSSYLDCPLPSLFKERMIVQLSRFCEARYCIVRHVGFLTGHGRVAGDAFAAPETIDQALALLSRPPPDMDQLERSLLALEASPMMAAIPEPRSPLESALFDVLSVMFIAPHACERERLAVIHALGPPTFDLIVSLLVFVRSAHYWTQTHPGLKPDADMLETMTQFPMLANALLSTAEASWARIRCGCEAHATGVVLAGAGPLETHLQPLIAATAGALYRMSPDWQELRYLLGAEVMADAPQPLWDWAQRYIPEEDRDRVQAGIANAIASQGVYEMEHRVFRRDGSIGWVSSRAVPLLDARGTVREWIGVAVDITTRKLQETALRDADRRKDQFLATLGHELRNPLGVLRSGLTLISRQSRGDAAAQNVIDMMSRQLRLLVHLVDDLLDVGRVASGKIEVQRVRVKLRNILESSIEACRASIEARQHQLVFAPCDEALEVSADFDRLTQVFSNLLSNGTKYTEDGGRIELRASVEESTAVITVSDSGIGIPAEDLPHVFNVFTQVRAHRSRADGGLGIGLALVRQLVELHDGTVQVYSEGSGRGSRFVVRLPVQHAAAAVAG